jgi:hypothetical protein
MKVQIALALMVTLAAAALQAKGKGKGGAGAAGSAPPASGSANAAMKNGWEHVAKAPAGMGAEPCLQPEDCDYSHLTMNQLVDGSCKMVTFIFARATTELGNMVCRSLKVQDQIGQY